jgi:hypothetical protein
MIVVDSSVWIDYFNGRATAETNALSGLPPPQLVVGDLIMTEVLQGFASESDFLGVHKVFAAFEFRRNPGDLRDVV